MEQQTANLLPVVERVWLAIFFQFTYRFDRNWLEIFHMNTDKDMGIDKHTHSYVQIPQISNEGAA